MDPSSVVKNIGKNIKIERTMRGWTQKDLSSKCGLTTSTISFIENGAHENIRFGSLVVVAKALGITIIELFVQRNQIINTDNFPL